MRNPEDLPGRSDSDRLIRKLTVDAVEAKKEFAFEKAKEIYLMLKTAVENSYGAGHELLEIYLELIDVYISLEEYDEALLTMEEAEGIATDTSDRLEVLQRKTKYLFSISKYDEARELALKSLELAEYPGGDYIQYGQAVAHFLGDVAKADLYMDRVDDAIHFAEKAADISERAGALAEQSRAMNILAYSLRWRDSDNLRAIEIWKEAAELAKQAGTPEVEGNMYHGIANAYWQMRDGDRAREYYRMALSIFENIGLMEGIAMEVKGIGDTYLTEEEYDTAMDYFVRAEELYRMLGDDRNRAVVRMHMGLCQMNLGDFRLALDSFMEAKALSRIYEKGSDSVETAVLLNLADLYHRMKMYDMEEKTAREALLEIERPERVREKDVDLGMANLYLGRVEMARGNTEEAERYIRDAIEGLKKDPYYLYMLAEAYSRLHALTGKETYLLAAMKHLRDSGSSSTLKFLKDEGLIPQDVVM